MDERLISNWNEVVGPNDTVFHLGDFSFRSIQGAEFYRSRLNGKIHLIRGNHDTDTIEHNSNLFESVKDYSEIRLQDIAIIMCHYPMREWNGVWRGAWHLFGHVHSRLDAAPLGFSLDVGGDSNNYYPTAFGEIKAKFQDRNNPFEGSKRDVG